MPAVNLEEVAVAVKFIIAHKELFQEVLGNIPTFVTEIEQIVAAVKQAQQPAPQPAPVQQPETPAQPADKTVIWGS